MLQSFTSVEIRSWRLLIYHKKGTVYCKHQFNAIWKPQDCMGHAGIKAIYRRNLWILHSSKGSQILNVLGTEPNKRSDIKFEKFFTTVAIS